MLAKSDVSEMIHLLGLLDETEDRKEFFEVLCHGFENLLNIKTGAFIPYDRSKESFCIEGHLLHNVSTAHYLDYVTYYYSVDHGKMSGWTLKGPSFVKVLPDKFSEGYEESEFTVDFLMGRLSVFYAMGIRIATQGDFMGFMPFHRTKDQKNFDDRDCTMVEIMANSIASMFHRREFFGGSDPLTDSETGFLVIGAQGEILFSNPLGRQAVQDCPSSRLRTLGMRRGPTFVRSRSQVFRVRTFPLKAKSSQCLETRLSGRLRQEARILLFEPLFKKDTDFGGFGASDLTPKQREVTLRVLRGLTNREIAEDLGIAEQTVKVHMHGIFDRLGLRNRSELTARFTKSAASANKN